MADSLRRVITAQFTRVPRQAEDEKPALLGQEPCSGWCPPRGSVGMHEPGDIRYLQLRGALPHRREDTTTLLCCESTRKRAAAAVHVRLAAGHHAGHPASAFTIEFPVPAGAGAPASAR
jgi:hypothetical protein